MDRIVRPPTRNSRIRPFRSNTSSTSLATTGPSGSFSSRLSTQSPRMSSIRLLPHGVRIGVPAAKQVRMPRNDATPPIAPFTVAAKNSLKSNSPPLM